MDHNCHDDDDEDDGDDDDGDGDDGDDDDDDDDHDDNHDDGDADDDDDGDDENRDDNENHDDIIDDDDDDDDDENHDDENHDDDDGDDAEAVATWCLFSKSLACLASFFPNQKHVLAHSAQRRWHTACKPTCNFACMQLREPRCRCCLSLYDCWIITLMLCNHSAVIFIAAADEWKKSTH